MALFADKPVTIINFKAYAESTGAKSLLLAKACEKVAQETGKDVWVAVHPLDLRWVAAEVKIPVICQHADPVPYGAYTGWVPSAMIKDAGAKGVLINHSEHQLPMDVIGEVIEQCRRLGLKTIVCADTAKKAEEVATLKPDFVAIEPPELIGGDISVSSAKPELVSDSVARVRKVAPIPVLCGAGIKNGSDVRKAHELGAKGILVASGVTKAQDPEAAVTDLVSGYP